MNFVVYQSTVKVIIIAETLRFEDAEAVLNNWTKGYITDREGNLLKSK